MPFLISCESLKKIHITCDYLVFGHFNEKWEGESCIEPFKSNGPSLI